MRNRTNRVVNLFLVKQARRITVIPTSTKSEGRGFNCNTRLVSFEDALLTTRTTCPDSETNASYLQKVYFINFDPEKSPQEHDVMVNCECNDFYYGGPMANLYTEEELANPDKFPDKNISPNVRDPQREKYLCKHLVSVRNLLRNINDFSQLGYRET